MTEDAWWATGSLSARVAEQDGAAALYLAGELDLDGARAVERQLTRALEKHSRLIVDLSALTFMDSSGIAVLERTKNRCDERNAQLVVRVGDSAAVRRVLDFIGGNRVFDVTD